MKRSTAIAWVERSLWMCFVMLYGGFAAGILLPVFQAVSPGRLLGVPLLLADMVLLTRGDLDGEALRAYECMWNRDRWVRPNWANLVYVHSGGAHLDGGPQHVKGHRGSGRATPREGGVSC